jgi:superfamily II DNA or RNA helicase
MQLRDYQEDAINAVRKSFASGSRAPVLVSPTGSGKTVMFCYIAEQAALKGNRILILVHRQELLDQTCKSLSMMNLRYAQIAAGRTYDPSVPIVVASVGTLVRRLDTIKKPDLLIVDEAHHAMAGSWKKIIDWVKPNRILGVTATPERLDGKGLKEVFDDLIRGPEVSSLIERGFLSPVKYFCPPVQFNSKNLRITAGDYNKKDMAEELDKPAIVGDAVKHYKKVAHNQPAICFCVSLKAAHAVALEFQKEGYKWDVIDGTLTPEDRRDLVRKLGSGELHGLSSCEIVSEGFDLPVVSVAILLRPTASVSLHLQQIGRVLRVAPNKPHAIILDHVGNVGSMKDGEWTDKHGIAEEIRDWSLDGRKKKKGAPKPSGSGSQCPNCFAMHFQKTATCPLCGYTIEVKAREIQQVDGELVEIQQASYKKKHEQGSANTLDALIKIGTQRGYKNPYVWATHVMNGRKKKQEKRATGVVIGHE